MRIRTRLVATLLALPLAVPGTAHATTHTWRDDDGTMETSVRVDAAQDFLAKDLALLDGAAGSASSATVWVYGRAAGCGTPGATQFLRTYDGYSIATFDPCDRFPTASFGWAAFPFPVSYLNPRRTTFDVFRTGPADGPSADYGVDTGTDHQRSFAYDDGVSSRLAGELMIYLTLDGNAAAIAATPSAVDFGMALPGTAVTRTVTVTSSGTATAHSVSVALSGAGDYAVTSDGCAGTSLAVGATCPVVVTFTPAVIGARTATLTVSSSGGSRAVPLTGQGRSAPPASTIATPDGAVLTPVDTITGTVTDDLGVAREYVTLTPIAPVLTTVTASATLSCDAARTACSWSLPVSVLTPGRYRVTARGIDVQDIAETPGPGVSVVVV